MRPTFGPETHLTTKAISACFSEDAVVLGVPADPLEVPAALLIGGRRAVAGWPSGTSTDSQDAMAFSVQSGVRSMNEVFPLERASEAYDRMMSGEALSRVVLSTGN